MPEMKEKKYVYRRSELIPIEIAPDSFARFILSERALVSFVENPPDVDFPIHSHDAEQILIILEGTAEHVIDGNAIHLEPGDVVIHPPNVPHGGTTKTGNRIVDIFVPPRESHVDLMRAHGLLADE